jgi:hypothetical protein
MYFEMPVINWCVRREGSRERSTLLLRHRRQSAVLQAHRPHHDAPPPPPLPCYACSKSIAADKQEEKNVFLCPVYKTEVRGPTFVFLAQLKTKSPSARWVMAGAALICDVAM